MPPAVVSRRKDGDQLTTRKAFEAVHYTLVCSKNVLEIVVFQELSDTIWTKLNNISGSIWVTDEIGLNAQFLVAIGGITPQNINDKLLLRSGHFVHYFQWPLDFLDLVECHKRLTDSTM